MFTFSPTRASSFHLIQLLSPGHSSTIFMQFTPTCSSWYASFSPLSIAITSKIPCSAVALPRCGLRDRTNKYFVCGNLLAFRLLYPYSLYSPQPSLISTGKAIPRTREEASAYRLLFCITNSERRCPGHSSLSPSRPSFYRLQATPFSQAALYRTFSTELLLINVHISKALVHRAFAFWAALPFSTFDLVENSPPSHAVSGDEDVPWKDRGARGLPPRAFLGQKAGDTDFISGPTGAAHSALLIDIMKTQTNARRFPRLE